MWTILLYNLNAVTKFRKFSNDHFFRTVVDYDSVSGKLTLAYVTYENVGWGPSQYARFPYAFSVSNFKAITRQRFSVFSSRQVAI